MELAQLGINLRVVTPQRWMHYGKWREVERPQEPPYNLEALPVRFAWCGPAQSYLHYYPGMAEVLYDFRPDVIDLWEEPWSFVSLHTLLMRAKVCPRVPVVCETEQNIDKTLPPPFETFRSQVLRRADFVVGRNSQALEIVRRKGYVGPSRVVPNAVDAVLFQPLPSHARIAKRMMLGWGQDEFWCGYVGRLVEEKGITDLLDALALCGANVRCAIIGSGPFLPQIQAHIERLGLQHRVQLRPALPLEELAPVMGALDALVLPSRTTARWKEQFGRVLIEANACGMPAIGSDSGAIPDVVGAGGHIFPEGDTRALAEILNECARAPSTARQMGEAGRRAVLERYTWARVAQQMKAIYSEVSGKR